MKRILVLMFSALLFMPILSFAAVNSMAIQDYSILNCDLSDSCINARNLGTSVINDTKLASTIEGRIFLTLVYDSQVFNTAGLAADGTIIMCPENPMSGSMTIERITILQFPVAGNNETFCLSCDNGGTYDSISVVTGAETAVLSSFTNFLTWASGKKLNIRVSGGGSNTIRYCVNFIIQAKYSIKND